MEDELRKLMASASAGTISPAKWNGLINYLGHRMITGAGGLAAVVRRGSPTVWVSPQPSSSSVAHPFMARPATEVAMEDLPLSLSIGTGLVRGLTEYVAPSNAAAEFTLLAETDYVFYLEASISTASELTDLVIDFAEAGSVPASPEGDPDTGEPPATSYHPFMTISTTATAIDWTTEVHDQSNYILGILPRVVECEEQTLIAVWLRA